jgi:hypothetical protein
VIGESGEADAMSLSLITIPKKQNAPRSTRDSRGAKLGVIAEL